MTSTNMNTETLNQGMTFKKQQNKIKCKKSNYITPLMNSIRTSSTLEGFTGVGLGSGLGSGSGSGADTSSNVNQQAHQLLQQTNLTQSQSAELLQLKSQFNATLQQYQALTNQTISTVDTYISSQNNSSSSSSSSLQNMTNVFVNNIVNDTSNNFIGCYTGTSSPPSSLDTSLWNNGPIYNVQSCQQAAIDNGYKFFGLQSFNPATQMGNCSMTNNLSSAVSSGKAQSMCSQQSDGYIYGQGCGSGLVNALYQAPTATFVGTYGDNPTRAMTLVNGGSQTYTYNTCLQEAISTGSQFFALQDFNSTSQTAQCTLSNNFTQASEYGTTTNSTVGNDGNTYGGSWANSIYQVSTNAPYLGCYTDNATTPAMTNSGTNQSYSTCLQLAQANGSAYFALQNGGPGTATCMTSNSLQQSQQYGVATACSQGSDGNQYGNCNTNALYGIAVSGTPADLGNVGYVDANGVLSQYPASMIGQGTTYTQMPYTNNPGGGYNGSYNDWTNAPFTNSTVDKCQAMCDASNACVGFVFETTANNCWPKTSLPIGNNVPSTGNNTYVRNPSVINSSPSCSKNIVPIDSVQWEKYTKSSNQMSPSTLCGLAKTLQPNSQQLNLLKGQLLTLAEQIIQKTNTFKQQSKQINNQTTIDSGILNDNLEKYKEIIKKFGSSTANINGILSDSNIKVLQNNYNFIFWSILAVVLLIIVAVIVSRVQTVKTD